MGRGQDTAAPAAPTFSPSEVKNGDTVVSKTYLDPSSGSIVTQYIPDPVQAASQAAAQQQISQVMSTLGTTAPEMAQQFDQTAKAFTDAATQQFNQTYDPALTSLREDIASRFGTLNTSQFLSGLDKLQQTKANALANIADNAQMVKSSLVNQAEANKLNTIKTLGGVLSADQSTFLNDSSASLSASDALNNFLNGQWMQSLRDYTSEQNSQRQMIASIVGSVAGTAGRIATAGMG